ncbi:MAG: rRNA maturation RNase YbeY [Endomicrobium sp.]|uniref:rRNA maturation RNase YbeY n=1 Tax=Candidatus Endomicrobiellum pyrsonymphae TaxID=1408203 RepID=UPI003578AB89|nr:rRNA maturation RNase YbeY [Endomicrobium sp.]MCA6072334.1 rRNA maturation RNase YbeY [Endomicrobium sp.]
MITNKNNNFISFVDFPKQYVALLEQAVVAVLKSEKVKKYQINFIMVSNQEIKKLNIKYRKVRRITDVISFLVVPELFIGDIYISKNRAQKQAKKYGNTWQQELSYLAIHGVLHLCGYTDYDVENKTKMFDKQDKIFKCLFSRG